MSYIADAQQILDEAVAAEAERICFRTASEFRFAQVDLLSIESALQGIATEKYKFQRNVNGRWSDISGYARIFDTTKLFNELTHQDPSTATNIPVTELIVAIDRSPQRFHFTLRRILSSLLDRLAARPNIQLISKWSAYFSQVALHVHDEHLEYVTSTLELLERAFTNGLDDVITTLDRSKLKNLMQELDICASSYQSAASQVAALNLFGKIYSLIDRQAAADCFKLMKDKDSHSLIPYFYTDMGALTYYTHDEIVGSEAAERTRSIRGNIQEVSVSQSDNELGILASVDPHFFRIYGGLIYYYAQQLPHVDFNFLICGDQAEVHQLISDGNNFVSGLVTLNKSGTPNNISFFHSPVPDATPQAKTFYASARFYAVQTLLERYPRIYLMDADLTFTEDPTRYFDRIRNLPFAAPEGVGLPYLSPWRRFLAGNIPFNRAIQDTGFLDDLQNYLSHGLAAEESWMLDQNAIAYAIEMNFPETYVSLNSFNRPVFPPKFRSVWERNYFSRK